MIKGVTLNVPTSVAGARLHVWSHISLLDILQPIERVEDVRPDVQFWDSRRGALGQSATTGDIRDLR